MCLVLFYIVSHFMYILCISNGRKNFPSISLILSHLSHFVSHDVSNDQLLVSRIMRDFSMRFFDIGGEGNREKCLKKKISEQ